MKKRKFRALAALCVSFALVGGIVGVTAFADADLPTVIYDHEEEQFVFRNIGVESNELQEGFPNLFQNLDGVMPGDEVSQEIRVTATGLGSGSAMISLRAEPVSTKENPTSTNAAYATLLDADGADEDGDGQPDGVRLTVTNLRNGKEISGSLGQGVDLGRLYSGDELALKVTLDIPVTVGNELQGLQATVGWVFTAAYRSGGSSGGGDGDGDGGTEIPEETVPLAPLPELESQDHFAYIVGRDDGLVHPAAQITRGEVATIFFRLLTDGSRDYYWGDVSPFTDVVEGAWYKNAVVTLNNAGIIYGRGNGIFDPNAPITRAEFASIATRFFGGGYDGPDLFSDISGHWAQDAINKAADRGIVNGYVDGTFRPDQNISRAEAIAMINRTLDRRPHEDHLLEGMTTWPDNMDTDAWYYVDIQEATNSHDFDPSELVEGEAQYEIWTELLPEPDWTALERQWAAEHQADDAEDVTYVTSRENAAEN